MTPIRSTPALASAKAAPAALLAAALVLASTAASAVDQERYDYQGAAGVCQAATPAYEANLRSRPLGLANTGTTEAFVTCAIQGSDPTGQRGAYQVQVHVSNNDTVPKAISCTLVVVYRMPGESVDRTVYSPRRINLNSGGGGFISWVPTDLIGAFGGPEISKSGVSCNLPAKSALQYTGNYYREDVGA